MIPARWSYILTEAAVGLRRNLAMTMAVVLSIMVTLSMFGASILLRQQVGLATGEWLGKVEMSIFLCDGNVCPAIDESQRDSLERDLEANPLVQQVFYESKEDAYQAFLVLFAEDEELIETVTPDALPPSFRVKLVDPEDYPLVETQYQARPEIEEIADPGSSLEVLLRLADLLRFGALAVAAILMIASVVLVANTVRVAAFARREQTQIMKLVGASNWYIRLPFVLEGLFAALLGAAVAYGGLVLVTPIIADRVSGLISFFPVIGLSAATAVWPWLFIPAVIIGTVSSLVALWGFLDV